MGAVKVISPPFLIVEGRAFIFRSNSMHSRTSVCVGVCMRAHDTSVVYVCVRGFFISYVFPRKIQHPRWRAVNRTLESPFNFRRRCCVVAQITRN